MNSGKKIITRMAPSPTGEFHIGGVRTALFNYIFAKHNGGKFIIRSEDTDEWRSERRFEDNMLHTLEWLGIKHDEFFRQSERIDIYKVYIKKLIKSGNAYEAEASKNNPNMPAIRFRNPNKKIKFTDIILGNIEVNTTELGDFVIARDINTPVYHLTVVIDDELMKISHVLRGQEHINNTPRQILILEALGFDRPKYAHIPLIMSPSGGKLSKRDPGVIPAFNYKDKGILPEALINFLAFIGWNPGDEREIMSMEDLITDFDIKRVQKGGGVFNIEKLYWINKHYLNLLSDKEFYDYIKPVLIDFKKNSFYNENMMKRIIPIIRERIQHLLDLKKMIDGGELDFYFKQPELDLDKLPWKKDTKEGALSNLEKVHFILSNLDGEFNSDTIKPAIWSYAEEVGKGNVLWPLRYALSGREKSPDPFEILVVIGKNAALSSISFAINELKKNTQA